MAVGAHDREGRCETLISLHETEGIGWQTIRKIVQSGALDGAEWRREADWRDIGLQPKQAANAMARLRPEAAEAARRKRERAGVEAVTALDPRYPQRLLEIPQPPWVLYYIGRLALADQPSVAIVGTRAATAYGRRAAEELAAACADNGLTVVSGLARGIDAAAHAGALRKPAGTVAVLATPADTPYPPENRQLYRDIARGGLVLSEAPLGATMAKGMFPLRNRIIAGLTLGTVVVEAAARSGAMITAELALATDRDVFAVPGPITSPRSVGPINLLKIGAIPVAEAGDIMAAYPYLFGRSARTEEEQAATARLAGLEPDERRVYERLLDCPQTLDELAAGGAPDEPSLEPGALHAALLALQIKRLVVLRPGAVYAVI